MEDAFEEQVKVKNKMDKFKESMKPKIKTMVDF